MYWKYLFVFIFYIFIFLFKNLKAARHGHNMTAKLDRLKKTEEEGIKRLQAVRAQQAERKEREDAADNTWELPFFEGEQPKGAVLNTFNIKCLIIFD